jgi:arylsulfatase A-like enzyme
MIEPMSTRRPNIIWIFGDQHRAQACGYAGDPNAHTPTLDALAGQGLSFSNAVAGCPWCTPFRGALLTSRYVHQTVQRTPQRLDPSLPTVADAFNQAGYHTYYLGKWHLDGNRANDSGVDSRVSIVPSERRGRFQRWEGFENSNHHFRSVLHGGEGAAAWQEQLPGYETDCLTDRLLNYLDERAQTPDDPFFAICSITPPHDPYVAPREYMQRYTPGQMQLRPNVPPIPRIQEQAQRQLAGYYAAIENLDYNVGRVWDRLAELKLQEDTYVFFFADHGDMHGSHGHWHKSSPWEESIRIPCVVAGGRLSINTSRRSDAPINHVDYAPTSLGLCGIPVPTSMAGTDFSAHIHNRNDGTQPARDAEPSSAYIQQCVRKNFGGCNDRTWRGIRTRDGWKYVCLEGQPLLMVNLNEDPYELENLAYRPEAKAKRAELSAELQAWIERTDDSFVLPEI